MQTWGTQPRPRFSPSGCASTPNPPATPHAHPFCSDVPRDISSVELKGSWDNFTHSYRLQRDPKRSSCHFWGIFTFKDIVCDGENMAGPTDKREGGLKMGGVYWYHVSLSLCSLSTPCSLVQLQYVLEGVYEYHDKTMPSTTTCPLLLGECVNILEVPREEKSDELDFTYSPPPLLPSPFTLDPNARFSTPRPNKFEALARKPSLPPPSPFYPSPATPSCEGSCRSSLSLGSDQSYRLSISMGSDSGPSTSYSRHGLLNRPMSSPTNARPTTAGNPTIGQVDAQKIRHQNLRNTRPASVAQSNPSSLLGKRGCSRRESDSAGHGLSGRRDSGPRNNVALQEKEQQSQQRHGEVRAVDFDDDVLSDSGATLACWQHKDCLLQKREGVAKTEAQRCFEQESYANVDAWIEHTTIALLDGDVPWFLDNDSPRWASPTKSDFSDILDDNTLLEKYGYCASQTLLDCHEESVGDGSESFVQLQRLSRVVEESSTETDDEDADLDTVGEPLHRCLSDTEKFVESFELPLELSLDNTFALPPLNTHVSSTELSESAHSAITNDVPQLEDSGTLSPSCSSATTTSSVLVESFHFWSEQDGEENGMVESYVDDSAPPMSPGLLPTISHARANSWFSSGGFQGYSLPEDQYSSQATLTKVTTQTTIVRSESPPLPSKRHTSLCAVNSELESTNELMNDFSYLGEAVI